MTTLRRSPAAPGRRTRDHTPRPGLAFLLVLGCAAPAVGQQTVTLDAPVLESKEPFSALSGLRELSDGTLLIADGLEGKLLRVSSDLSSSAPIGREGAGPQEYRTPDALYAMAADSTLMVDLGNGRLAILAPDASIVRTIPIASGGGADLTLMIPGGVDGQGRVYYRGLGRPGPDGSPDSATVNRSDPRSERSSQLARMKLPSMKTESRGGANNREQMSTPVPLSPQDVWTTTPDGRLVLARSASGEYWLDVVEERGLKRGPRIPYEPIPVRRADKEEWIASLAGALGVSVEMENGRARTSFSRSPNAPSLEADDLEWPETKPAFPPGALRAASDGSFWLERYVAAGEAPRYDVLDASGKRVGVVRLPKGRRLVGFGNGSVYLTRSDELEFRWLERYRLPAL